MPLPLIILAGGAKPSELVPDRPDSHRLFGPKGVTVRIGGRPLIDLVIERFQTSGAFEPIFIAGPAASYGPSRGPATVIDTDGDFGTNIRVSLEVVVSRLSPSAVGFSACDVIPDPADLKRLIDDYRAHAPLDFWFPLVRVPEERSLLGASAGKREYRVRPESERDPLSVLPGHLAIVDPSAIRLRLIYRALELAYRSRTRPVFTRSLYMTSHILLWLLWQDAKALVSLRMPLLTLEVVYNAVLLSHRLGTGIASQTRIEAHLRRLFVNWKHRGRFGKRRGRIPVIRALSMAKDIDTDREAEELSGGPGQRM